MKQDHGDRRSWGGDQAFPLLYHAAALQASCAQHFYFSFSKGICVICGKMHVG